jgi:hypothetical protein
MGWSRRDYIDNQKQLDVGESSCCRQHRTCMDSNGQSCSRLTDWEDGLWGRKTKHSSSISPRFPAKHAAEHLQGGTLRAPGAEPAEIGYTVCVYLIYILL